MSERERVAWASYRVALGVLLTTVAFSAITALLSYRSLTTAQGQLTVDQQPMVIVDCSFPGKSRQADYFVSLNHYSKPQVLSGAFRGYNVQPLHSFSDCKVHNYGRYPLMDLDFVLDVLFSRDVRPGVSVPMLPRLRAAVPIEGVSAGTTEDVIVENDDPCNQATISVEASLNFLNIPYKKSTAFLQPGTGDGSYTINPVAYTDALRHDMERRQFIQPCSVDEPYVPAK